MKDIKVSVSNPSVSGSSSGKSLMCGSWMGAILTQSLAQLDLIYGRESRQVIADNCSYKAILKATDADTQEYFSKLVGTYDKRYIPIFTASAKCLID